MIGTILCIMSVLPLFLVMCLSGSDLMYIGAVCLLLGFVALACIAFVYAGTADRRDGKSCWRRATTPARESPKAA